MMTYCIFIRTKEWMQRAFSITSRGCIYPGGYCSYWENCVKELNIEWFESLELKTLKKHYDKEKLERIIKNHELKISKKGNKEIISLLKK